MWGRIKRWFGRGGETSARDAAEQPSSSSLDQAPIWLEVGAKGNPFAVRVIDVRPITRTLQACSTDPTMAKNAVSFAGELGDSFAAKPPVNDLPVRGELLFRAPAKLSDGMVFAPTAMEDKWAIFVQGGELIVVRSWRREVFLRATLTREGELVRVHALRGRLLSENDDDTYTLRFLDFLIRTHALGSEWPAPLSSIDGTLQQVGAVCMSLFGRRASFAALEAPERVVPEAPLRVYTRLHLAVARDDLAGAKAALAAGVDVSLLDGFGLAPIHHLTCAGSMLELLLANGAQVDAREAKGTTPLMFAVQAREQELFEALLDAGAEADAADGRGFSALHRAAEMGEVAMVKLLLARGADPDRAASGDVTPRALAEQRGEREVLALFPQRG